MSRQGHLFIFSLLGECSRPQILHYQGKYVSHRDNMLDDKGNFSSLHDFYEA